MSLFTRVLLANAVVLAIATLLLLFSPIEISYPVTDTQAVILIAGFVASVILNMLLLREVIAPLRRLTATMRSVEPLQPGRRLAIRGTDTDVAALTEAFNDMLDRLESERRESGRQALLAQEAERQRIARELHDEVGQVLTGVVLELEHASQRSGEADAAHLAAAREAVRRSLDDVRRIARDLRPDTLEELGLRSALSGLAVRLQRQTGLTVERRLDDDLPPLGEDAEIVVYRVVQEALTNVVRHAGAERVVIALGRDDGAVTLTVDDDGRGVPAHVGDEARGITGMRERALLVRARLTVGRSPLGGTRVTLRIPAR